MEPRLADLGLYVGFDTYVEFHLRGVEPGAELQADRQCADDFAVDVQRVSGICRAFRIEVVGQHVHYVAAEVDPAEVVGYVFDFQIRQVAAGQISDLAGQLLLQSRSALPVDGLNDLIGLLNKILLDRSMSLRLIPGTAAGGTEQRHNAN